jgi:hypothetical protein
MKAALLRIGIDTGSGGIHAPLFQDGTFEYIPIPDQEGVDERTYGNTIGRHGRLLLDYFPTEYRRSQMANRRIHFDPEFETFTYGDPTPSKDKLTTLQPGDMLIFYCGLEGWNFACEPALYLMGYFEIQVAARAADLDPEKLEELFSLNFHVRHTAVFDQQRNRLALIKGSSQSRLLKRAVLLSAQGTDGTGRPLKVLSPEMQQIFGDFDGKIGIQRNSTRWIDASYVQRVADFIRSLD